MRSGFRWWVIIGCVGLLAVDAACLLADCWWRLELLCHFQVPYFAAAIFALLMMFVLRSNYRWYVLPALLVVLHGARVLSWYLPSTELSGASNEQPLRLLEINVHTSNRNHQAVLDCIQRNDPDVVALLEVDETWMRALEPLLYRYAFHLAHPRPDNFGIAVFSKLPWRNERVVMLGPAMLPTITAYLSMSGDTSVRLVVTHPLPPVGRSQAAARDAHLSELADLIDSDRAILVGDLNVSMWSPAYNRLVRRSELLNARQGFGIQASWPDNLRPLRIPIDHCLLRGLMDVLDCRVLRSVGSDHLPLRVDLRIGLD